MAGPGQGPIYIGPAGLRWHCMSGDWSRDWQWVWLMERRAQCPEWWVGDCRCKFAFVWNGDLGIVVYPRSRLVVVKKGVVVSYRLATEEWLGLHRLNNTAAVRVEWVEGRGLLLRAEGPRNRMQRGWDTFLWVELAGPRVRAVQRWWRGVRERRWRARALAVAMGAHGRLGAASGLRGLDGDLLRLCLG